MSVVRWGRAVQPLKWLWQPMIDVKGEGVHCLAATDGDGDGYPEVLIGSQRLRYLVRQKDETYVDQADQLGTQSLVALGRHVVLGAGRQRRQGDVVVIYGTPEALEHAETVLLTG